MKKIEDIPKFAGAGILWEKGGAQVWGNTFWRFPWRVYNCLCEDGIRRCIRVNVHSDYVLYGSTKIKNKSARGFVTIEGDELLFVPYKERILGE